MTSNISPPMNPSFWMDQKGIDSMSSEISRPVSTGINFGQSKVSRSIQWVSRGNDYYPRERSEFNGKIELNFLWLLMFLIYLVEFYGLFAFVVNYIKWDQKTKI
jgi:hypothetical protein